MKIFISSPGDVQPERRLAKHVLEKLKRLYRPFDEIKILPDDDLPAQAGTIPHQESLPKTNDCDMVVCILWNRMGTSLPESYELKGKTVEVRGPNGEVGMTGTEYEFAWGLWGWKQKGLPMLMVYRKNAPAPGGQQTAAEARRAAEQLERVEQFERQFVTEEGTHISARHRFKNDHEFAEIFELHARQLIKGWLKDQGHDAQAVDNAKLPPVWPDRCPFRGLARFEYQHAPVFFGRERLAQEIASRMQQRYQEKHGFLLLIGGSGSGKSSLLRAGVAPLILHSADQFQGSFDVQWRVAVASLDAQRTPLGQLAVGLLDPGQSEKGSGDVIEPKALPELESVGLGDAMALRGKMADDPGFAAAQVLQVITRLSDDLRKDRKYVSSAEVRLLLVIDQLEQLFRDDVTAQEREQFIHVLESLANNGRVCVLAALRNDFYSHFQKSPRLMALRGDNGQIDVLPPTPAELEAIVRNSAEAAGLTFEANEQASKEVGDLADQLIHDAVHEPNSLPLLELALQRLYVADCTSAENAGEAVDVLDMQHKRRSETLRYATYNEFGGVSGVVKSVAEELDSNLSVSQRAAHSRLFWHLIRIEGQGSDEGRHIGSAVPRDTLAVDSDAEAFIEKCVQKRLLSISRQADGVRVRLSHESLVDTWPLLKQWIADNRELLPIRERVEAIATRWNTAKRPRDLLLSAGKPLDEAQQLINAGFPISSHVQPLVEASEQAIAWSKRLKRVAVAALATLTIAASIATGFAMWFAKEADAARGVAERQTEIANEQADIAEQQSAIAQEAASRANDNALAAQALAAESIALAIHEAEASAQNIAGSATIELRNDQTLKALELFASGTQQTKEARQNLLSRIASTNEALPTAHDAQPSDLTSWVALTTKVENSIWLGDDFWRQRNTSLLRQFPYTVWSRNLGTAIQSAVLSPDNRFLALCLETGKGSDQLAIWSITENLPTPCLIDIGTTSLPSLLCWSPDSEVVYVVTNSPTSIGQPSSQSTITNYAAATGKQVGIARMHPGIVHNVSCSPDGARLYVVNRLDGSLADVKKATRRIQESIRRNADPEAPPLVNSAENESLIQGATVSCLSTADLTVLGDSLIEGMVMNSSIAADTVAIGFHQWSGINRAVVSQFADGFVFEEVETRREPGKEHWKYVKSSIVELSSDGEFLVTDTTNRGLMLHSLEPHVSALGTFGNASSNADVRVWSTPNGAVVAGVEPTREAAAGPTGQADSDNIVASSYFDKGKGAFMPLLSTNSMGRVSAIDWNSETGVVAIGATNGSVRLWQPVFDSPQTPILKISGHCLLVRFIGKQQFLTVSEEGAIRLWDLAKNSLGETVLPLEISSLSSLQTIRDDGMKLQEFWAPNGETTVLAHGATVGVGELTAGRFQSRMEFETNLPPDQVLFTSDSRVAIVLCGLVNSSSAGLSPLLTLPGSAPHGSPPIPKVSQVWICDLQRNELIGDAIIYDGPIVHAAVDNRSNNLIIGALVGELSKGKIDTINLQTRKRSQEFGVKSVSFATMTSSANHDGVVVVSRNGIPFLYRRGYGRPIDLRNYMDFTSVVGKIFAKAVMSANGRYVLVAPGGDQSYLTLVDLALKVARRVQVKQTIVVPMIERVPGKNQFVVGTEAGEFLIIDCPTGKTLHREEFGSGCSNLCVDGSGTLVALITRSGVLHIRNVPDGNLVLPDLPIPVVDTTRVLINDSRGELNLNFLDSGDIIVGDFPTQRLRLSPVNDDAVIHSAVSSLLGQTPTGQLAGRGGSTEDVIKLDWYDKYTLARYVAPHDRDAFLDALDAQDLSKVQNTAYARAFALRYMSLSLDSNEAGSCRRALEFLLSADSSASFSTDEALGVIPSLASFDPERGVQFLDEFESAEHDSSFEMFASALVLFRGRMLAGLGQLAESEACFSSATSDAGFRLLERYRPDVQIANRVDQSLLALALERPPEAIMSMFASYEASQDPSVVVGPTWIAYLLRAENRPDLNTDGSPLARDERIAPLLSFCAAMGSKDAAGATRLATHLIENASDTFVLQKTRTVLPFTRAHAVLLKADALKLEGNEKAAVALLAEAEEHWQAFVTSATDQGIDERMLWPWRISYEHLLERHRGTATDQP